MDVRRGEHFRIGEWLVFPAENRITGTTGSSCHLSPKAMDVLVCLARNIDSVVPRDALLAEVWGTSFISEGVLANAVSELRGAFGDSARHSRFIETIPKRGYRLVTPQQLPATSAQRTRVHPAARLGLWLSLTAAVLVGAILFLGHNTSHAVEPTRLAVLEFSDLTPSPGDPALAHGMSAMLITDLTRLHGLRVISGYGVSRLGPIATNNDYPAIARRLGARLLLDGTVLRQKGHIQVAIWLIDGQDGSDVWRGSFESPVSNALDLQRNVARTVVRETQLRLSPKERDWLQRSNDVNPGALLAYTKGVFFYDQWDKSVPRSLKYFKQAIDLDPNFAPPRARLARSLVALAMGEGVSPAKAYIRARDQAEAAVHLDDQLADAHDALAMVNLMFEWHFKEAEAEANRALKLNPSSVVAYETQSLVYMAEGRRDADVNDMKHALALAPLNYYAHLRMAWTDFMSRRYHDNIKVLKSALELYPENSVTHAFMAEAYAMLDQPDEVLIQCRLSERGCIWPLTHVGLDNPLTAELREHPNTHSFDLKKLRVDRMRLAGALADLGRPADAFVQLNKAIDEGSPDVAYFATWPELDPLRADPRWKPLMARIARGSPVVLSANANE